MNRRSTFALLLALLAGCATGPRQVEVPRQRLQAALERRFPYDIPAGLFTVKVSVPRLELLPQDNRVRLDIPIDATDRIVHRTTHGEVDVSFGLRFDAAGNSLRMQDVRVENVAVQGVPRDWREPLQAVGGLVAAHLLEDAVLHTFTAEDMARAHGWRPGNIRVTPGGVAIELLPPA
jgi:hypothetical protein